MQTLLNHVRLDFGGPRRFDESGALSPRPEGLPHIVGSDEVSPQGSGRLGVERVGCGGGLVVRPALLRKVCVEGPACIGTREDHWKGGERSWTSFDSGVPLTQRSGLTTRRSEFPRLRCELRMKRSMPGAVVEGPREESATILERLYWAES